MMDLFEQHRDFIIPHTECLLSSFRNWLGRDLIEVSGNPEQDARRLFQADIVVVSGGTEPEQILNYGNETALRLWEMDWDRLTVMPSRETAEPMHREARAEFLRRVRENGYVDNYEGIRISSSGRRFRIKQAIVWNLLDGDGKYAGQAATFGDYEML